MQRAEHQNDQNHAAADRHRPLIRALDTTKIGCRRLRCHHDLHVAMESVTLTLQVTRIARLNLTSRGSSTWINYTTCIGIGIGNLLQALSGELCCRCVAGGRSTRLLHAPRRWLTAAGL